MTRRRVLIVQPSFQPPGGGHAVAAWMLEALRGRHHVGVLTWEPLDLDAMNRFYGTSVQKADVTIEPLARWIRAALDLVPSPIAGLKYSLLLQAAAKVAGGYDLCVSVNNEADFRRPGVQYIHYPYYQRPRPGTDLRWFHGLPALLGAYCWSVDRLAGFSAARMKWNLTLTNSDWTGRMVQRLHGISSRTLYPPVPALFPNVPWQARRDGFLCIGRFAPEKELDRVIDILARVRAEVPDVTLCLVGTPGPADYYQHIKERARASGEWITVKENLSRADLLALIPTYRYGIHGMLAEHFGMAPAEMASAGCIVFVPNDGGQVEIVNRDPRLLYETVDDAAASITRIMRDPVEQQAVREMLSGRARAFSVERFTSSFLEIVEQALETE